MLQRRTGALCDSYLVISSILVFLFIEVCIIIFKILYLVFTENSGSSFSCSMHFFFFKLFKRLDCIFDDYLQLIVMAI